MKNGLKIKKRTLLLFPAIFLIAIQFYDEVALLQRIDATGLKHILILLYIMIVIAKGNSERRFSFFLGYELKRVCTVTSILVAISFFFMIQNGFSTGWISETYFFIIPILFVYCIFRNNWTRTALEELTDMMMIPSVIGFVMLILQRLAEGTAITFSFIESKSPFEIESAHLFLLLYIAYTYLEKKKKSIVCAICCILAWKRMTLIYLIFVALIHKRIKKDKSVPKSFYVLLTGLILFVPLIFELLLTDSFSDWFTSTFGINLHNFLMFRFETIVTAFESSIPNQGLGTFLTVNVPWYGRIVNVSIHNDIVRLYLEVTPVGLACFAYGYLSLARNQYSFLVIAFMFIEMIFSHFLGNGSLPFWILAFSMICCFNRFPDNIAKTESV